LGQEVKVRSRGAEIAVELRFQDLQEAAAFAKRLGRSKG
jgi:hypothetical protein